jgi:hypothetical protein
MDMLAEAIGTVTTIDHVVAAMRALHAQLADDDGLKWFNFLYLRVTEAIREDPTGWRDRAALERFDVIFARLYFDAIVAWERDPRRTPHAWRPLLRARGERRLARLQFALAGMNAHINHDLALALEQQAAGAGSFPTRDSADHHDFQRVNDVLERTEAAVRDQLATGLTGEIDRALGDADSLVVMWKVRKAREAAWTNGEVLWHLRATPTLRRDYVSRLDLMTAFAGRGLLLPRLG